MKQRAPVTIKIFVDKQQLVLLENGEGIRTYPVSTSRFGLGFKEGSRKTPTGRFRIAEKIGEDAPPATVFKGRKRVPMSPDHSPDDDLIVARILWLDGLGKRNANTRSRYIYIHGTNHEDEIGQPKSNGCVRMKNADVIELFDLVRVGTPILISRTATREARSE